MISEGIIPAWLEFHDLNVSGVAWEGDTLTVTFSFGTVYDEEYKNSGYRTGEIVFTHATTTNAFPANWEEDETYLSTGDIFVGSNELSNLPIPGANSDAPNIKTRFHFVGWEEPIITSSSVTTKILGLYKIDKPDWWPTSS